MALAERGIPVPAPIVKERFEHRGFEFRAFQSAMLDSECADDF